MENNNDNLITLNKLKENINVKMVDMFNDINFFLNTFDKNNENVEKRHRGRPKKENIITTDNQNRNNIVKVEYLKKRYNNDPEFKEKCKLKSKLAYEKRKEENKKMKKLSGELII
jgi:hypothetical protein